MRWSVIASAVVLMLVAAAILTVRDAARRLRILPSRRRSTVAVIDPAEHVDRLQALYLAGLVTDEELRCALGAAEHHDHGR